MLSFNPAKLGSLWRTNPTGLDYENKCFAVILQTLNFNTGGGGSWKARVKETFTIHPLLMVVIWIISDQIFKWLSRKVCMNPLTWNWKWLDCGVRRCLSSNLCILRSSNFLAIGYWFHVSLELQWSKLGSAPESPITTHSRPAAGSLWQKENCVFEIAIKSNHWRVLDWTWLWQSLWKLSSWRKVWPHPAVWQCQCPSEPAKQPLFIHSHVIRPSVSVCGSEPERGRCWQLSGDGRQPHCHPSVLNCPCAEGAEVWGMGVQLTAVQIAWEGGQREKSVFF